MSAALGIVAFSTATWHSAPERARTCGKSEEFKLLGFLVGSDNEFLIRDGVKLRRTISRPDMVASAWVDIGSHRLRRLESRVGEGLAHFYIQSRDESKFHVPAYLSSSANGSNIACLSFHPGSGGKFQSPDLVCEIDGKVMGRWRIEDYPTDKRVIPSDEPLVTAFYGSVGLSVEGEARLWEREYASVRNNGQIDVFMDVKGYFDPDYEYWVYWDVTESTWRTEHYSGRQGSLFTGPRRTGGGGGREYAAFADRIRVEGLVDKYAIYEEAAHFSGIRIERSDLTGSLFITNHERQVVELSTGVIVVLPVFSNKITAYERLSLGNRVRLRVPLKFPESTQNLELPKMMSRLGVSEGIQLKRGLVELNGRVQYSGSGLGTDSWMLGMLVDPATVWADKNIDLSVGIKHLGVVESEPFEFLLPIVPMDRSPATPYEGTP